MPNIVEWKYCGVEFATTNKKKKEKPKKDSTEKENEIIFWQAGRGTDDRLVRKRKGQLLMGSWGEVSMCQLSLW